jgi:uncharacterized protein (TIGR02421 family)
MSGTLRPYGEAEVERLGQAAGLLRRAERSVRVLRTIAWPVEVGVRFLEGGAEQMPEVAYVPLDPTEVLAEVAAARALLDGNGAAHNWLRRVATSIEDGARMLAAVGTPRFFELSCQLYGRPTLKLADGSMCPLDLAIHLDEILDGFSEGELVALTPPRLDAEQVAETVRRQCERHFGSEAPTVEVVDVLSANALAGAKRIRLRRGASFTDRDVHQLVHHEAFVHAATTLIGLQQVRLPVLASGHPGTTRTQEGLAVFAEFISGSMDPDRLRRLADRTIAIEKAIDGADFIEVYRFFLHSSDNPSQAFENARRVFRGGVLTGGAPFTKDGVYLEGLLRVHNFLRAVVQLGRTDCLHLLFCGKLDIEDLPALATLAREGMVAYPRFVPPWAHDLRFLVSYLAYSGFLHRVDLSRIRKHYAVLLGETSPPPIAPPPPGAPDRAPAELRDVLALDETGWPTVWGGSARTGD